MSETPHSDEAARQIRARADLHASHGHLGSDCQQGRVGGDITTCVVAYRRRFETDLQTPTDYEIEQRDRLLEEARETIRLYDPVPQVLRDAIIAADHEDAIDKGESQAAWAWLDRMTLDAVSHSTA